MNHPHVPTLYLICGKIGAGNFVAPAPDEGFNVIVHTV
jgi:hypothetical protein